MEAKNATVLAGAGGEAYVQWVRRALVRAFSTHEDARILFSSSVEEPIELLRQTVVAGFEPQITSRYQSVLAAGNPFVIDELSKRYGVDERQILPTTGATGALSLVYRSYLSAGDHILVESPGFDLFADIARALKVEVDNFSRNGDRFEIDLNEVERQIRDDTRLIVISNLHNPSGMLIGEDVLTDLARLAELNDIKLVVDEVYGDYADDQLHSRRAAQISSSCISVSSLTKIYGLSTLRCGWVVANAETLAPIRHFSDQFEFGISKLSHAVAALVLENRVLFDEYWRGVIAAARPIVERYHDIWEQDGLASGALPEFGCIAFPRMLGIDDTKSFSNWLADRHGVIVVPGELFGAPGRVRLGFAQEPRELERALADFTEGLREYVISPTVLRAQN